jgi:small-conductance mechanosensitive channel
MIIDQVLAWFRSLSPELLARGLRVAITVVLGLFLVRVLAVVTQRYIMKKSTALLGAAGIVGIAVGFASQTSVSNIISGLFLISEKPFAMGDVIKIGGTTGIIQSIDLLSIKIRTFDNLFVRIPNEKILSSEVTNITRFPIRRLDVVFQVDYGQDLGRVHDILAEIARANPWCLDEPEPVIVLSEFKDSGIEVLLGLWFSKSDFLQLKNSIMQDVCRRFADEEVRFAHPNRLVRIVEGGEYAAP